MWSKYPESKPEKSGYYMTYYYNHQRDDHFFKAIYYNNFSNKWVSWKPGLEPMVYEYNESTHDDYYCPCMDKWYQILNKEEE